MVSTSARHTPAKANGNTTTIESTDARRYLGRLMSKVEFGHERVLITRRGRVVAALVPAEEVEALADGAAE